MTLKEIKKLIDESDVIFVKNSKLSFCLSREIFTTNVVLFQSQVKILFENNGVVYFYERNEETGEMTLLAKVDHIDKEKKIVKKRLDEMTREEVGQLKVRLCSNRGSCIDCPLHNITYCCGSFPFWKERYEECKDKEFEVEVEE